MHTAPDVIDAVDAVDAMGDTVPLPQEKDRGNSNNGNDGNPDGMYVTGIGGDDKLQTENNALETVVHVDGLNGEEMKKEDKDTVTVESVVEERKESTKDPVVETGTLNAVTNGTMQTKEVESTRKGETVNDIEAIQPTSTISTSSTVPIQGVNAKKESNDHGDDRKEEKEESVDVVNDNGSIAVSMEMKTKPNQSMQAQTEKETV